MFMICSKVVIFTDADVIVDSGRNMDTFQVELHVDAGSFHSQAQQTPRLTLPVGDPGNHSHGATEVLSGPMLGPPLRFNVCSQIEILCSRHENTIISFLPIVNNLRHLFLFCFASIQTLVIPFQYEIALQYERRF
jgi:hypothetical protein